LEVHVFNVCAKQLVGRKSQDLGPEINICFTGYNLPETILGIFCISFTNKLPFSCWKWKKKKKNQILYNDKTCSRTSILLSFQVLQW